MAWTLEQKVAYNREYRKRNPERVAVWKRNYLVANREKARKYNARWYESHREHRLAYNKGYYEKNKVRLNEMTAEWIKRERKTNPLFRLKANLTIRVHHAIKSQRTGRTMEFVGCTIEFLKGWLESRFQPGMSWENYGKHGWHVDHVIPCKAFDLGNPVEVKQCFHYSNLQPLWAKDNLRKASSIS